jgi:hypothetical protein
MAVLDVDFSETDDMAPVPAGVYKVQVSDVKDEVSKNDNPMLVWEVQIIDGDFKGRKLWTRTVLTPKSLWFLKRVLSALGVDKAELKGKFEFDPSSVVGKKCGIVVVISEWEGEDRNEIKSFVPLAAVKEKAKF